MEFNNAVRNWFTPTNATSDLYSSSQSTTCILHPHSTSPFCTGNQSPRTGKNFAGMVILFAEEDFGNTIWREYISVKLLEPLIVGKAYKVEMFVSLADSLHYATSSFGMYFSNSVSIDTNTAPLELTPQFEEITMISDKDSWTRIAGRFVADSAYQYLTIGNFSPDSSTGNLHVGGGSAHYNFGFPYSYYYIDDVSVTPIEGIISKDTLICAGDSITMGAYGGDFIGWAIDSAPEILIATDTQVTVSPHQSTKYLFLTPTDTFSVMVRVHQEFTLSLGSDSTLCLQDTLEIEVPGSKVELTWQNGSRQPTLNISEPGTYWVTVDDYCGTYSDTIKVDFIDCNSNLEMPNVFSPNNDGVNEFFKPITFYGTNEGQLHIYNRNGERVYASNLISAQWDGTHNDLDCPEGVYYWVGSYNNMLGEQKVEKGFLTLVK